MHLSNRPQEFLTTTAAWTPVDVEHEGNRGMCSQIRVRLWNEFRHERTNPAVEAVYPDGIHGAIAKGIAQEHLTIQTATLDDPDQGITPEILAETDVLFWWGHKAHKEVLDETVNHVQQAVLAGMGLVVLHSGHESKVFQRLMGTSGALRWREAAEREILWNLEPAHPILEGVGECVELPHEEMYGERFDIPTPDETLMISWFQGGEVFRSLCTWRRGHGRIVYFRPGHETYPTYHDANILRILGNAAQWAARRHDTAPASVNSSPKCPLP